MSSFRDAGVVLLWAWVAAAAAGQGVAPAVYAGIGRAATQAEIQAWDIDVRPDFKGLPAGAGSVADGMKLWEAQCASCHGVFGESNEVFAPIVGGTAKADISTGRVARLTDASYPGRTTLMKLSSLSTLWDYIHRAMPWTAPKTLKPDEVYAVTAYILNLGGVVPDGFVLSNRNVAEVQGWLPNRNGMTTAHALWPGARARQTRPDVTAVACMKDCATEATVASLLPEHARNAHGNLAEQNRHVGAQRGADTSQPGRDGVPLSARTATPAPTMPSAQAPPAAAGLAIARKYACTLCHGAETRLVGPGFNEIAARYAGRSDAASYLAGRIAAGSVGIWGAVAMPAQSLPAADAQSISRWLADGAPR